MQWAASLRRELSATNRQIALASGSVHELTQGEMPSVIFGRTEIRQHGNFHPPFSETRQSRMGPPPDQSPYRLAKSAAPSGMAMEGTRLRQQFRRPAHECPRPSAEKCKASVHTLIGLLNTIRR
jgi:hypothetical protein